MSNALAIQAVTECLQALVREGIRAQQAFGLPEITGVDFSTDPPFRIPDGAAGAKPLNLFLYRVEPNAAWRNLPVPGATRPGGASPPPLALNLHYLITVVKPPDGVHEHHLIGRVMAALHDHPMLTREDIERFGAGQPRTPISRSELSGQFELVKFTPRALEIDELVKLWSGFESKIRLSVAYEASVVLIESLRAGTSGPPVLSRGLEDPEGFEAQPGAPPLLTSARFVYPPDLPEGRTPLRELAAGRINGADRLVIDGENLLGESVTLRFRHAVLGLTREVEPEEANARRIVTTFSEVDQTIWPAGPYLVSAVIDTGRTTTIPAEQPGPSVVEVPVTRTTNEVPMGVVPQIESLTIKQSPNGTIRVLEVIPKLRVQAGQKASLLLDGIEIPVGAVAREHRPRALWLYLSEAHVVDEEPLRDRVHFIRYARPIPVKTEPPLGYLVRLRVDGVDSLAFDPNQPQLRFDPGLRKVLSAGTVDSSPSPLAPP